MIDKDIEKLNTNETEKKYLKIIERYSEVDDYLIHKFFDLDSYEMLDEKLEVLEDLINGKNPKEIPNYYKILEKYPKNENNNNIEWD